MPTDPKGVNAYPSAGPYYIASRDVGRQIVAEAEHVLQGPAPRERRHVRRSPSNTNLDQSLLQVKSGQVDYDMGGLPPTAHCRPRRSSSASTRAAVLRQPARRDRLRRAEHVAAAVRQRERCARPPTSRSTARRCSASAARSPASAPTRSCLRAWVASSDAKVYPIQGSNYAKAKALAGNKCGKRSRL